jgi:hypothetical protein
MSDSARLSTASWIEDAAILLGFDMDDDLGQLLWEMAFTFSTFAPPVSDDLRRTLYGQFDILLKRKSSWKSRDQFLEHFRLLLDVELKRKPGGQEVIDVFERAVAGKPYALPRPSNNGTPVDNSMGTKAPATQSTKTSRPDPAVSSKKPTEVSKPSPGKAQQSDDSKIDDLLGSLTKPQRPLVKSAPVTDEQIAKQPAANASPESSEAKLQRLLEGLTSGSGKSSDKPKSSVIGNLRSGSIANPEKHDSLLDFLASGKKEVEGKKSAADTTDAAINRLIGNIGEQSSKANKTNDTAPQRKGDAPKPTSPAKQAETTVESQDEAIRRLLGL